MDIEVSAPDKTTQDSLVKLQDSSSSYSSLRTGSKPDKNSIKRYFLSQQSVWLKNMRGFHKESTGEALSKLWNVSRQQAYDYINGEHFICVDNLLKFYFHVKNSNNFRSWGHLFNPDVHLIYLEKSGELEDFSEVAADFSKFDQFRITKFLDLFYKLDLKEEFHENLSKKLTEVLQPLLTDDDQVCLEAEENFNITLRIHDFTKISDSLFWLRRNEGLFDVLVRCNTKEIPRALHWANPQDRDLCLDMALKWHLEHNSSADILVALISCGADPEAKFIDPQTGEKKYISELISNRSRALDKKMEILGFPA